MQIKADDVNVFLRGGGALDINSVRKKPKVHSSDAYTYNASCDNSISAVVAGQASRLNPELMLNPMR